MIRIVMLSLSLLALTACGGETAAPNADANAAKAAPEAAAKPVAKPMAAPMQHHTMAKETLQYVCAGDAETKYPRPGKCEDGSLRMADAKDGTALEYYCPMDADQLSEKPGKCGECGMYLSARVKGTAGAMEHGHGGEGHDPDDHEHH